MRRIAARRALSYGFALEVAGDDALATHLDRAYASLPSASRSDAHEYAIARAGTGYELAVDGAVCAAAPTRGGIITEVVHTVNTNATNSWDGVVCHAGGVARGAAGFVFPAQMEWGKTTLTAGLVRAGFEYLSDEAVAFRAAHGCHRAVPEAVVARPGIVDVVPELDPGEEFASDQWHVAPDAIRSGAIASPCRVAVVAFARYQPGAVTELVPVSKGEALVEMAKNTFRFGEQGRVALEALADVVRGAECYQFPVGDLADACAVVGRLADRIAS